MSYCVPRGGKHRYPTVESHAASGPAWSTRRTPPWHHQIRDGRSHRTPKSKCHAGPERRSPTGVLAPRRVPWAWYGDDMKVLRAGTAADRSVTPSVGRATARGQDVGGGEMASQNPTRVSMLPSGPLVLVQCVRNRGHDFAAGHAAWRRRSSVTNPQFAPSSRLGRPAPRGGLALARGRGTVAPRQAAARPREHQYDRYVPQRQPDSPARIDGADGHGEKK